MGVWRFVLVAAGVLPWLCRACEHDHHHHHHHEDGHHHHDHDVKQKERDLRGPGKVAGGREICGTHVDTNDPDVKLSKDLVDVYHEQIRQGRRRLKEFQAAVPVYYHVIQPDEDLTIPLEYITRQNDKINEDFAGTGFTFVIQEVIPTINADWYFAGDDQNTQEMYRALHQGGLESLNVFLVGLSGGLLGFSSIPHFFLDDVRLDAMSVYVATLPGIVEELGRYESPGFPYGLGGTLTHEIGHWLNLFHTFQGGCNDQYGDFVDDTAFQSSPTFGCETEGPEFDTCRSRPGFDSVNNIMNYQQDACALYFSPQQIERMQAAWIAYRSNEDCYSPKYSSDGTSSVAGFCERRCRLQVPIFYGNVMDCIEEECRGGDTCETPTTVILGSDGPSEAFKGLDLYTPPQYTKSTATVTGNTKTAVNEGFFPTSGTLYPLFCGDNVISSTRKYYEFEGDGSIVGLKTSSFEFYPSIAVATDGCELNCVRFDTTSVERAGVQGGVDSYLVAEEGVKYLVIVHGIYGGEFTLTIENGVQPDSDCFTSSFIPTCTDTTCNDLICLELPECCSVEWGFECVLAACENCSGTSDTCEILENTYPVTVEISTDIYPDETTWEIVDVGDVFPGKVILSGGPYFEQNAVITERGELYVSCFEFILRDSFGDGGAGATVTFFETFSIFVFGTEERAEFGVCGDIPDPESNCYEVSQAPGCLNATCSDLVCQEDPACCFSRWSTECIVSACSLCGDDEGEICEALTTTIDTTVTLELDGWPSETTWEIIDLSLFNGSVVVGGGPYDSSLSFSTVVEMVTLYPSCFDFALYDSYGDGGPTATIEYGDFIGSVTVQETLDYLRFGDCEGIDPRPTPSPTEGPEPSNCFESSPLPGCTDPACTEVVCDLDPFCCANSWDGICANIGCDVCFNTTGFAEFCPTVSPTIVPSPTVSPAPTEEPAVSNCFESSIFPNCTNAACTEIVCVLDSFCCTNQWDSICVGVACANGCEGADVEPACVMDNTTSPAPITPTFSPAPTAEPFVSNCFESSVLPNCTNAECSEIVCLEDSFCCGNQWDSICVELACANQCTGFEDIEACANVGTFGPTGSAYPTATPFPTVNDDVPPPPTVSREGETQRGGERHHRQRRHTQEDRSRTVRNDGN